MEYAATEGESGWLARGSGEGLMDGREEEIPSNQGNAPPPQ